jgi:hypothetical protein
MSPAPVPILNLEAHYERLRTCPELIDTRDHLPLFRSLTGRILEIGCDVGNSTTAFLVGPSISVTSIDINPACANNFPGVEKWRFIHGDSRERAIFVQVVEEVLLPFDVLYVDGNHTYDTALSDLRMYTKLVRPGGLVLVHDVLAQDNFPGVWRAFSEFRGYAAKYVLPGSYGLGVIEV